MHALRCLVVLILASGSARAAEYVWKNAVIGGGGYVTGIEYHPAEPGLAYAPTDVRGVYRRDSGAGPWIPLNDRVGGLDNQFMDLGVLSVAIDPADANRVYLACGQYLESWAPPARFMSSSDRGATWTDIALPLKLGGNLNGRGTGERLAVDPHDGTRITTKHKQRESCQRSSRSAAARSGPAAADLLRRISRIYAGWCPISTTKWEET